ncbi:OLC1v1000956C1, partial [Oldenlandia corymbosa var. corymbosa]
MQINHMCWNMQGFISRDIDKLALSEDIPDAVIDSTWDFIYKCAYMGNRHAKDLKSTRA